MHKSLQKDHGQGFLSLLKILKYHNYNRIRDTVPAKKITLAKKNMPNFSLEFQDIIQMFPYFFLNKHFLLLCMYYLFQGKKIFKLSILRYVSNDWATVTFIQQKNLTNLQIKHK